MSTEFLQNLVQEADFELVYRIIESRVDNNYIYTGGYDWSIEKEKEEAYKKICKNDVLSQQAIDNFITYQNRPNDNLENLKKEFDSSFSVDLEFRYILDILKVLGEKYVRQATEARKKRLHMYAMIIVKDWIANPKYDNHYIINLLLPKEKRSYNLPETIKYITELLSENINLYKQIENIYKHILLELALSESPNSQEITKNTMREPSLWHNHPYSTPYMMFDKDFFIKNVLLLEHWGVLQKAKVALCIRYKTLIRLNPYFVNLIHKIDEKKVNKLTKEIEEHLDFVIAKTSLESRKNEDGK